MEKGQQVQAGYKTHCQQACELRPANSGTGQADSAVLRIVVFDDDDGACAGVPSSVSDVSHRPGPSVIALASSTRALEGYGPKHKGNGLIQIRSAPVTRRHAAARSVGVLLLLLAGSALGQAKEFLVGPVPAWVKPIAITGSSHVPVSQVSDGTYYLLSDTQVLVLKQDQVEYRRFIEKALNSKGVESVANIAIDFDPAFQVLTLHAITVWRSGHPIPQLANAKIRILQRETELENRIYDGSKTANIFLDDVRVGDAIEYAYSVRGINPVLGNHQFGSFRLQFGVPVQRVYARVRVEDGRHIWISPHNVTTPARQIVSGDYEWQRDDVPSLTGEEDTPSWYDPDPAVDWSDYPDWQAVAQWAQPLYRAPATIGASLQAEVDRIARLEKSSAGRLLATLHFVQSEIRYLGVEIGPGSHAPNPPDLVLKRRFGDCKDKALLMTTMLDRLGIKAHPALVNTTLQRSIASRQPHPLFDHAIVLASIDGRDYWLDPTRSTQQGDLEHVYQPDYGYALVIGPQTHGLKAMWPKGRQASTKSILAVFDARSGFDKPTHYTVTTTLEGDQADSFRDKLSSTNREELQKGYVDFYARWYPDISVEKPFEVTEDGKNNRVTATEHYVIAAFSQLNKEKRKHEVEIHAPDMYDLVRDPSTHARVTPLGLGSPYNFSEETQVLLPEPWPVDDASTTVVDPAFSFERTITNKGTRLVFVDHFQSRAEAISPQRMATYTANLQRTRDELTYLLSWNMETATPKSSGLDRFNWTVALLGVLISLGWAAVATSLYRRDPVSPSVPVDPGLQGIRGWLILPAIGVIWTVIRTVANLISTSSVYAADTWANLTVSSSASYDARWAPMLLFELSTNLAFVVFSILLLVMFFQQRRSVPRLYIAYLVGAMFFQGLDLVLSAYLPAARQAAAVEKDWTQWCVGVFRSLPWILYFLVSKRVKSTFIRTRPIGWMAAASGLQRNNQPAAPVT